MHTIGTDMELRANGITMCYDDLGESNIPVIFIHGFPFDKSSWQPQMDYLKNTHRVIAYDIRGFGKSGRGDEKLSIGLFADDLIRLMDLLRIKKAIVCGLSMGGYILLNAINRYPDRFEAIILSDTQCIPDTDEAKEKRYSTIKQIESNGLIEFAAGYVKNVFCENSLTDKKEIVKKIQNIILSTSQQTITETLKALVQRWETCSSSENIAVPTLILCGKEDKVTPITQSQLLNRNIPSSAIHIVENAGHMSNLEQPEQFNRHLYSFLSGVLKNSNQSI
jgi:3-oxoadipate enol-lactonase